MNLTRRFSNYGLIVLLQGYRASGQDLVNSAFKISELNFIKRMFRLSDSSNVRINGYQVYPNGKYFPVPIEVAEKSDRYEDERIVKDLERKLKEI